MNQDMYESIKSACLAQRAKGVKIVTGMYGVVYDYGAKRWVSKKYDFEEEDCACAFGAYLNEEQPPGAKNVRHAIEAELGLSKDQFAAFIRGFDTEVENNTPRLLREDPFFKAGIRMRDELGLGAG